MLLQDLGVVTNGSYHDLIRVAATICFSAAKCSLRSWLYCVHHGLGLCLFGGGVSDLGGRCRARASGQGMWDVEGGGWGSGVDYLHGSTRLRSVKEGRRQGGGAQARSEGLNLERKAEQGKCGFW